MTTMQLEPFKKRAADALRRIARSVEMITTLLKDGRTIAGAVISGEPQLIRDLEFVADDLERLEDLARRKVSKKL